MSIIVIRHPETEWNRQGLFQGIQEGPVTVEGLSQAQRYVQGLPYIEVHHIYHAPNQRTQLLAELLQGRYPEANLLVEPRLQERSFGVYEGKSMEEVGRNEGYSPEDILARYSWKPPYGESYPEVSDRVNEFVEELRMLHPAWQQIICITSGGVMRNILHVQKGLSLAEIFQLRIDPLEAHEIPH